MKQIELSQGKVALVDDQDFEYINQWKWCAHFDRHNWYAERSKRFPFGKYLKMHRVILGVSNDMAVDHINGNGLDNRRANLRVCTKTENNRNARMRKDNTSGYKGVSASRSKYRAEIKVNGKKMYLGTFDDSVSAALAYDEAAKKYHGKFARLNFPDGAL